MEEIKVSIVCITYNHKPYIRDAIEGFLKQKTNFKYEILIHDDASTDGTAEIVQEYQKRHPDIITAICQKENQHSKGIKITKTFLEPIIKGAYTAVCEGDDFWIDENKLQKQVDFLENHPEYCACTHSYNIFDMRNGTLKRVDSFDRSGEVHIQQIIEGDGNLFATCSIMCKSDVFINRPKFREISTVGDYPLAIMMGLSGKVYYSNEVMSCYRYMSPGSWSARNMIDNSKKEKHIQDMQRMLEEADKYSLYKYHDSFEKIIQKKWFAFYRKSTTLWNAKKKCKKFYNSFSTKEKLYINLQEYFPIVLQLRNRFRKY